MVNLLLEILSKENVISAFFPASASVAFTVNKAPEEIIKFY
jgi:hypothetical protein